MLHVTDVVGASNEWALKARELGHDITVYSYDGVKSVHISVHNKNVIRDLHTPDCDLFIKKAASNIDKHLLHYEQNIIRTFYHCIKDVNTLYVIGDFENESNGIVDINNIHGKNIWYIWLFVEIYKSKYIHKYESSVHIPIYFYAQKLNKWFTVYIYDLFPRLVEIRKPKSPDDVWAGVGSRVLLDSTKLEIKLI